MADNQECAICKKMMKKKHKFDKFYKIGFWILLVFSAIMTTLYCCKGDLFKKAVNEKVVNVENNTDVDVIDSDSNTVNIDNGSYHIS